MGSPAHAKELSNIDLRQRVSGKLQAFYINLRVIYDKSLAKERKAELRKCDPVYKETLYEADKNFAHKDEGYKPKQYSSFGKMTGALKEQLEHCLSVCQGPFRML